MILSGTVTRFNAKPTTTFNLYINTAWVTVKNKDGKIVYKREPSQDNWLDSGHERIFQALHELENALLSVLPKK